MVWTQIDFIIYTFHMPLFFYLSGLNVMRSREKPSFFKRRAKALILPYIVFSLLQGGIQVVMSDQANGDLTLQNLILIILYPIPPFWFLYVLFIYTAIVSVWKPGWVMFACAILMLLISPAIGPTPFPWFNIFYFFSFFVAGALFPAPRLSAQTGIAALFIFGGVCVAALYLGADVSDYYALYMLPAAICGILAILYISQSIDAQNGALAFVGRNVLAIYVMHIIAAAGMRILLVKLGIDNVGIHLVLGVGAGCALPLIALRVLQRLGLALYFGFTEKRPRLKPERS